MISYHLRRWHGYVGAFIAPSMIFFALTGCLQIFNLHEAHEAYKPAPVVEKLGRLHKDQVFALERQRWPASPNTAETKPGHSSAAQQSGADAPLPIVLLKWFFMVESLGFVLTTCIGIWIGARRPKGGRTILVLLLAGTIAPLCLLVI